MARFHVDQCLGKKFAALLRQEGHDVVHSQDLGLKYAPDDAQLLIAANDRRILVSKNGDDFFLLHSAWQRWGVAWSVTPTHSGILIVAGDWQYVDAALGISVFVQGATFMPKAFFQWKRQWLRREAP